MAPVACRSCGHQMEGAAELAGGFRVWCTACRTRFFVAADAADPPDDGRDWLDEVPEGCLVCGGRVTGLGDPPCDRCGGTDLRLVGA
jgi:hypothetical protein